MTHSSGKPYLVCLHGLPGCGKDTIAQFLVDSHGFRQFSFADTLYDIVAAAFNVGVPYLREREIKEEPQQRLALFHCVDHTYRSFMFTRMGQDLYTPRTSRFHLEHYGTEFMESRDPTYWVRATVERMQQHGEALPIVISDLRAYRDLREYYGVKMFAAANDYALRIFRILRPGLDISRVDMDHPANIPLSDALVDAVIENRTGAFPETVKRVANYLSLPY